MHTKVAAYRTYAIALRPSGAWPEALLYDMQDPYHYVRQQETDAGSDQDGRKGRLLDLSFNGVPQRRKLLIRVFDATGRGLFCSSVAFLGTVPQVRGSLLDSPSDVFGSFTQRLAGFLGLVPDLFNDRIRHYLSPCRRA